MKTVVHHLNRDLAIAHGLGSDEEHIYPLADAHCVGFRGDLGTRGVEAVQALWTAGCYVPVAIVDGMDLDFAFCATNSINTPWWDQTRAGLRPMKALDTGHRSTSVGDVLEVVSRTRSDFYIVSSSGFEPLGVHA